MALSDPQSVTVAGTAITLPRVVSNPMSSTYSDADSGSDFSVRHDVKRRRRTAIRFDKEKIAADPLTAVNAKISTSVSIVIDAPLSGFTRTELKDIVLGLAKWCTDGSAANLLKVLGEEH